MVSIGLFLCTLSTDQKMPVNDQNSPSTEKTYFNRYKFSTLYQQQGNKEYP